jgi:hypothetical protein
MPSPFPGMDPYLESPRWFHGFHNSLIIYLQDLLRAGTYITAVPKDIALEKAGAFDYHVSVHRFDRPKEFLVYPIRLEKRLPVITVPLLPADPPVRLDLQAAFDRAYDAGPYRKAIWYGQDSIEPPLKLEQAAWAATTVKAVGAR